MDFDCDAELARCQIFQRSTLVKLMDSFLYHVRVSCTDVSRLLGTAEPRCIQAEHDAFTSSRLNDYLDIVADLSLSIYENHSQLREKNENCIGGFKKLTSFQIKDFDDPSDSMNHCETLASPELVGTVSECLVKPTNNHMFSTGQSTTFTEYHNSRRHRNGSILTDANYIYVADNAKTIRVRGSFRESSCHYREIVFPIVTSYLGANEPKPSFISGSECSREYCRLGCVCMSLSNNAFTRDHCGRLECMFNCFCQVRRRRKRKRSIRRSPNSSNESALKSETSSSVKRQRLNLPETVSATSCSVKLQRLNLPETVSVFCLVHRTYSCFCCRSSDNQFRRINAGVSNTSAREEIDVCSLESCTDRHSTDILNQIIFPNDSVNVPFFEEAVVHQVLPNQGLTEDFGPMDVPDCLSLSCENERIPVNFSAPEAFSYVCSSSSTLLLSHCSGNRDDFFKLDSLGIAENQQEAVTKTVCQPYLVLSASDADNSNDMPCNKKTTSNEDNLYGTEINTDEVSVSNEGFVRTTCVNDCCVKPGALLGFEPENIIASKTSSLEKTLDSTFGCKTSLSTGPFITEVRSDRSYLLDPSAGVSGSVQTLQSYLEETKRILARNLTRFRKYPVKLLIPMILLQKKISIPSKLLTNKTPNLQPAQTVCPCTTLDLDVSNMLQRCQQKLSSIYSRRNVFEKPEDLLNLSQNLTVVSLKILINWFWSGKIQLNVHTCKPGKQTVFLSYFCQKLVLFDHGETVSIRRDSSPDDYCFLPVSLRLFFTPSFLFACDEKSSFGSVVCVSCQWNTKGGGMCHATIVSGLIELKGCLQAAKPRLFLRDRELLTKQMFLSGFEDLKRQLVSAWLHAPSMIDRLSWLVVDIRLAQKDNLSFTMTSQFHKFVSGLSCVPASEVLQIDRDVLVFAFFFPMLPSLAFFGPVTSDVKGSMLEKYHDLYSLETIDLSGNSDLDHAYSKTLDRLNVARIPSLTSGSDVFIATITNVGDVSCTLSTVRAIDDTWKVQAVTNFSSEDRRCFDDVFSASSWYQRVYGTWRCISKLISTTHGSYYILLCNDGYRIFCKEVSPISYPDLRSCVLQIMTSKFSSLWMSYSDSSQPPDLFCSPYFCQVRLKWFTKFTHLRRLNSKESIIQQHDLSKEDAAFRLAELCSKQPKKDLEFCAPQDVPAAKIQGFCLLHPDCNNFVSVQDHLRRELQCIGVRCSDSLRSKVKCSAKQLAFMCLWTLASFGVGEYPGQLKTLRMALKSVAEVKSVAEELEKQVKYERIKMELFEEKLRTARMDQSS